jgi:Zn-dependent protease with chaperone function
VNAGLREPWCPSCDWNLDQETPAVFGWRWLDRRLQGVAGRLADAQFTALADGPLAPRTLTPARVTTLAVAVVLLAGVLAIAVLGIWLFFFNFISLATVPGAALIGVAFVLRPRLGRMSDLTANSVLVDLEKAPRLRALVERVATTVGAPVPQALLVGYGLNAYTATVGLRRTRVLCVGLPLWATLEPQDRVALLGHELGHFVNGDVRRGPLTQVAEMTLGRVAHLFATDGTRGGGLLEHVASFITRVLGRLVSGTARTLQLLLVWTSQRDSQRAEYLADEMAARAGGTNAAIGLANNLVMITAIDTVIRREARAGNGMPAWRDAARVARANLAADLPVLRKVSRQTEVSLYASHPPTGLRAEMLQRRPAQAATVTLTEADAAHIDDELAVHEKRVLLELQH